MTNDQDVHTRIEQLAADVEQLQSAAIGLKSRHDQMRKLVKQLEASWASSTTHLSMEQMKPIAQALDRIAHHGMRHEGGGGDHSRGSPSRWSGSQTASPDRPSKGIRRAPRSTRRCRSCCFYPQRPLSCGRPCRRF